MSPGGRCWPRRHASAAARPPASPIKARRPARCADRFFMVFLLVYWRRPSAGQILGSFPDRGYPNLSQSPGEGGEFPRPWYVAVGSLLGMQPKDSLLASVPVGAPGRSAGYQRAREPSSHGQKRPANSPRVRATAPAITAVEAAHPRVEEASSEATRGLEAAGSRAKAGAIQRR